MLHVPILQNNSKNGVAATRGTRFLNHPSMVCNFNGTTHIIIKINLYISYTSYIKVDLWSNYYNRTTPVFIPFLVYCCYCINPPKPFILHAQLGHKFCVICPHLHIKYQPSCQPCSPIIMFSLRRSIIAKLISSRQLQCN